MTDNAQTAERKARFDRLISQLYPDMYRFAVWLNGNTSIAEEVVQEALLRAWKSLDALRDNDAAKPWVLTIVRRENARYFERKRLEVVDIDDLSPAQSAQIAEKDDTDRNDLRQAISRLDVDYREPLVLQVLMGHSTKEIAEIMGIKPGAVLTRLHRARLKLKDEMEKEAVAQTAGNTRHEL